MGVVVLSRLSILLLFVLLLRPTLLGAHTGEEPTQNGQTKAGGLDEHLGARIPLDLTFRDETGKTVRLGELITGPTLVVPVYYHCTDVCNLQQSNVADALPSLSMQPGKEYRVISVSFDEHETPELAAKSKKMYLAAMNATFPADGWHFLTGDRNAIRRLTDAVGFRFERRGNDFFHPVVSLVVDRDGIIVRYLYGVAILPKDLALALSEADKGMTGPSIRKLVEYCYTYDPVGKTYVFNLLRISATAVILVAGAFLAFLIFSGRKRTRPPKEK
jgi:protein SCO1/2